jgi:hypothetical protein
VESLKKVLRIALKLAMRGIVEALLVGGECRTDVAPVRALSEIYDEVEVTGFPPVLDDLVLVLRVKGFNLKPVRVWAVRSDKVDTVSGVQEGRENLPAGLH